MVLQLHIRPRSERAESMEVARIPPGRDPALRTSRNVLRCNALRRTAKHGLDKRRNA